MFGIKKKIKASMRDKIIITYIDNYLLTNRGTEVDEWGNTWIEKSFNDVITSFKNNETNANILLKFKLIPMKIMNWNLNEEYIYAPYKVLFDIYIGREPNDKELNELRYEFKAEKQLRNVEIK